MRPKTATNKSMDKKFPSKNNLMRHSTNFSGMCLPASYSGDRVKKDLENKENVQAIRATYNQEIRDILNKYEDFEDHKATGKSSNVSEVVREQSVVCDSMSHVNQEDSQKGFDNDSFLNTSASSNEPHPISDGTQNLNLKVTDSIDESFRDTMSSNQAASKIQLWWRRHNMRNQLARAALKRFMQENSKKVAPRSKHFVSPIEEVMKEKLIRKNKLSSRTKNPPVKQKYFPTETDTHKDEVKEPVPSENEEDMIPAPLEYKKENNSSDENIRIVNKDEILPQVSDTESEKNTVTDDMLNRIFDTNACNQMVSVRPVDEATSKWVMMVNDIEKLLFEETKEPEPLNQMTSDYSSKVINTAALDTFETKAITNKFIKPACKRVHQVANRPTTHPKTPLRRKDSGDTKRSNGSLPDINTNAPRLQKKQSSMRESDIAAQSQLAVAEVTTQVLAQQRKVVDQSNIIDRYKRELEHSRELNTRQLQDTQKEFDKRLSVEREEHSSTLQRNYKLIDELIEEKKQLHLKCDQLVKDVKMISQKAEEKIKHMNDESV